jgi:hypothetical protein
MVNRHDASPQFLGYLFQSRLALLQALQKLRESEVLGFNVVIEKYDDVSFEFVGTSLERIQSKHHVKPTQISELSVDFWKSLAKWCDDLRARPDKSQSLIFIIVTTSEIPVGDCLESFKSKDSEKQLAHARLLSLAMADKTESKKSYSEKFLSLTEEEQLELLNSISIVDKNSNITDLENEIEMELRFSCARKFVPQMRERLEGWWFSKVIENLSGNSTSAISSSDLDEKVNQLRNQFQDDNLPYDDEIKAINEVLSQEHQERTMVRQLVLVRLSDRRIELCLTNYMRAFRQKARWMRDGLVLPGELSDYERRLSEEWESLFEKMKQDLGEAASEKMMRDYGIKLLEWCEQQIGLRLRPNFSEPFLHKGTLHELADNARIGWHAQFRTRLKKTLGLPEIQEAANE